MGINRPGRFPEGGVGGDQGPGPHPKQTQGMQTSETYNAFLKKCVGPLGTTIRRDLKLASEEELANLEDAAPGHKAGTAKERNEKYKQKEHIRDFHLVAGSTPYTQPADLIHGVLKLYYYEEVAKMLNKDVEDFQDLREKKPREVNKSGQMIGPKSLQVGEAIVTAWKRFPGTFLGYSFVQRRYLDMAEVAEIHGLSAEELDKRQDELYEAVVEAAESITK